ncbi:GNAT family N-acetyltransferase [Curtobacterium ammoniigenes]|uniref:GNAT family N-acetyltransferase n=1 Tax=Curtobacterium ammoniigenes TaxID=395387 RepID=UPI000829E5A9|nr:GNAT family N-acetyltransferase [Curtobacterium ammoniigenes]
MTIRAAEPRDVPQILELIRDLAEFEREPEAVVNTESLMHAMLFGPNPKVFAFVIDAPDQPSQSAGRLAAIAVWYLTYSTWTGVHGIHLEDLYVRPEHRRAGYGRAMLARLAEECTSEGYARLEWDVLDWNENAIGFYAAIGAQFKDDWRTCRLDGHALEAVATTASV